MHTLFLIGEGGGGQKPWLFFSIKSFYKRQVFDADLYQHMFTFICYF